ncbi:MAG: TetR/AcrR family transcriptional regulator [Planctomycetota bacterium]
MVKKRSSEKSRKRLLEAAIDVFARRGPDAATVDEICGKAGLNKRMLYHYFGSKESLYQQALHQMYQHLLTLDIPLSSMMLPAEKLIEKIVLRHHQFLKEHPDFVRLICYENLNQGRTVRKLKLSTQDAPVITALELGIKKGQSEKRFRSNIDVRELLVSILGLCFFYFSNRYTISQLTGKVNMTKSSLEKRAKHVVDLLMHGILIKKLRKSAE